MLDVHGLRNIAFEVDDVEASCKGLTISASVELKYEPLRRPRSGRVIVGLRNPDYAHAQTAGLIDRPQYLDWL